MKIFALYPQALSGNALPAGIPGLEDMALCMLGDTCSVPDHHPFFIPDFASGFEGRPALCVRLGRVGKSIAPRFAPRYIGALAPAILFTASDRLAQLRSVGLPWTEAVAFDGSAPVGQWSPADSAEQGDTLYRFFAEYAGDNETSDLSATELLCVSALELMPLITRCISSLSRTVTLKTGDLLYIALQAEGVTLRREMRLSALADSSPALSVRIR